MYAQLWRLGELGDLPHVTIQVLSFRAVGHMALGGPITVLRLLGREPAKVSNGMNVRAIPARR
jgi:Domain of unknown function (DUF5753)